MSVGLYATSGQQTSLMVEAVHYEQELCSMCTLWSSCCLQPRLTRIIHFAAVHTILLMSSMAEGALCARFFLKAIHKYCAYRPHNDLYKTSKSSCNLTLEFKATAKDAVSSAVPPLTM